MGGKFEVAAADDDRAKKVAGMLEKPAAEDMPSNLVATESCLLVYGIFMVFAALSHVRMESCSLQTP